MRDPTECVCSEPQRLINLKNILLVNEEFGWFQFQRAHN